MSGEAKNDNVVVPVGETAPQLMVTTIVARPEVRIVNGRLVAVREIGKAA